MLVFVLFSPDKIIKRHAVEVRELNGSPKRNLALTALVPLIYRQLHIQIGSNFSLRLIVVLAQFANSSVHCPSPLMLVFRLSKPPCGKKFSRQSRSAAEIVLPPCGKKFSRQSRSAAEIVQDEAKRATEATAYYTYVEQGSRSFNEVLRDLCKRQVHDGFYSMHAVLRFFKDDRLCRLKHLVGHLHRIS